MNECKLQENRYSGGRNVGIIDQHSCFCILGLTIGVFGSEIKTSGARQDKIIQVLVEALESETMAVAIC